MAGKKRILPDKLMWRALSDGAERFDRVYDLAVAFLEGGASYYVADHVKAKKKAAFIHVDYTRAGYTRRLDRDCYLKFDRIFTVSDEVREAFLKVYPQCREKTEIFHNLVDREGILKKAQLPGGFSDSFQGLRILTVGRLTARRLGREFVDTDQYIEAAQGRSIPDIFAAEGEDFFRERERDAAEELARREGLVIACGGGLPTRREAIAPLKKTGVVFWINRDPGVVYDTVSMAHRPLGQGADQRRVVRQHRVLPQPAKDCQPRQPGVDLLDFHGTSLVSCGCRTL